MNIVTLGKIVVLHLVRDLQTATYRNCVASPTSRILVGWIITNSCEIEKCDVKAESIKGFHLQINVAAGTPEVAAERIPGHSILAREFKL